MMYENAKPRTLMIRAMLLHSLSPSLFLSFSRSIISLQDVRLIGDHPRPADNARMHQAAPDIRSDTYRTHGGKLDIDSLRFYI